MANNPYRLNWVPNLSDAQREVYVAIADALAADIRSGKLRAGHKLPPQRLLAYTLGLNPGTVHKAYKLAAKRGLVSGEIGRGSFVRQDAKSNILWPNGNPHDRSIDFCDNYPCPINKTESIKEQLAGLAERTDLDQLLQYQQNSAKEDHKAIAASWIERFGVKPEPRTTLITNGALHAGFVSLLALCRAGDTVLAEELTSQAIKGAAQRLKLRLKGIKMDRLGIIPEHLDELLRKNRVSAVYLVPTIQNPTATLLSLSRRHQVAAILARHGVPLIEDDIFAPLVKKRVRPISSFIPDQSFYIAGLSKAVAPALRLAFMLVPPRYYQDALDGLRLTTWLASPLLMEIAAGLISNGNIDKIISEQRREIDKRQELAKSILGAHKPPMTKNAPHLWLTLPDPWRGNQFREALHQKEVSVLSSDSFAVERNQLVHAVRICLGTPTSLPKVKEGLDLIAETLHRGL